MDSNSSPPTLLAIDGLAVRFASSRGPVHAVRDLTLSLAKGEVVALVGESGSGKSTAALAIQGLLPRDAAMGGRILFEGEDLLTLPEREMRRLRGRRIGMIFQDPFSSLNPVQPIGWQIAEPLRRHTRLGRSAIQQRVVELLRLVGIPRPEERQFHYPHQFSGGMRQRVMIAMAVACDPALLIADEPTTALDVTIQEKIIELLAELRVKLNMSILLITHNLGLVARLADRVVVAYAGRVVETASVEELFKAPRHPYTQGLIEAVPKLHDESGQVLKTIPGNPPNPAFEPSGCAFLDRCHAAEDRCSQKYPPLRNVTPSHAAACFVVARSEHRSESPSDE